MEFSPSRSFATKLSIYVLSFTLIVFTCIMVQFYGYSRRQIKENAMEYTNGLLINISAQISGELQIVETIIKQSVWMVEKNLNQPDSLSQIITSVMDNSKLIVGSSIAFIPDYYREKGKYFMPYSSKNDAGEISHQVLGGTTYDYPCMDWFLIPKLLKQDYWSEPYYDTGGGNAIISTYSLPLYDKEGEVYAIFTADFSLSLFTDLVTQLKPYPSSYTFLLSRNGSFLSHPDREKIMNETVFSNAFETENSRKEEIGHQMLAGQTGSLEFKDENETRFAFFTAIPNCGWSVATVCSTQVILAKLDAMLYRIIYFFLLGVVILFPLIYHIIHRLMRPLQKFSESARVIATGRFDVELPEIHSKNEINDLRNSLVYMQRSLSTYVEELNSATAARERIESELTIAREIQMGMIPKIFPPYPERNDIDLHAVLQPAKEVGGDLYDFFISDERLYFVIGDVSGKGVPASLFMAIARSLFRMLSQQTVSPSEIMTQMNQSISDNNESSMFITLIIGVLDLKTGKLRLCNAGHNLPVLIHGDGEITLLKSKSQLFVGVLEEMEYVDEEICLEKDCRLFLYTDGISEAENTAKEQYGEDKLLEVLSAAGKSDACAIVDAVIDSVAAHVNGAEASDDITILVLHYQPEK